MQTTLDIGGVFANHRIYNRLQFECRPDEKQEILKFLLWNCTLKDATPTPVYRKPFSWLVELGQMKEWRGRRDDFGTAPPEPVASFVSQFRDWCFSGELTQLAYQIPALPLPA